jgi:hypothetical protein
MDITQGFERNDRIDAAQSNGGSVRKAVKWRRSDKKGIIYDNRASKYANTLKVEPDPSATSWYSLSADQISPVNV